MEKKKDIKPDMQKKELDKESICQKGLSDFQTGYDDVYINSLRERAKDSFKDINDVNDWLREIRGGYDK